MSMELWQRLKDLERKVSSQADEISSLRQEVSVAKQLVDNATLASQPLDVQKVAATTKKLCPKCGKVPGYFFHVRSCKG